MASDDVTTPDEATRREEEVEPKASHEPDRPPTAEEERDADSRAKVDRDVAEHERDMADRGVSQKGEGVFHRSQPSGKPRLWMPGRGTPGLLVGRPRVERSDQCRVFLPRGGSGL